VPFELFEKSIARHFAQGYRLSLKEAGLRFVNVCRRKLSIWP